MISNQLLKTMTGAKAKGGVSTAQLCRLINEFVSDQHGNPPRRDINGHLSVDDIPHDRRAEFLAALRSLAA